MKARSSWGGKAQPLGGAATARGVGRGCKVPVGLRLGSRGPGGKGTWAAPPSFPAWASHVYPKQTPADCVAAWRPKELSTNPAESTQQKRVGSQPH